MIAVRAPNSLRTAVATPAARPIDVLVAAHRYIGTLLCLVFVAWFASGIVMMYAGYPLVGEAEKLARTPPLDASAAHVPPAEAYRRAGLDGRIGYVRLGMLLGRPAYFFLTAEGGWAAVGADDGRLLPAVGVEAARRIVRQVEPGAGEPRYEGLFAKPDQWTIYSRWAPYLPSHDFSPFHKFSLDDTAGTEVSILASTGDLTQHTTRAERLWGYLGAVVHWIYPTALRAGHARAWRDLIVWLSAAGTALCVSGLGLGVWYYRWRRHPGVAASPYRGWLRWHHYAGLIFGVLASTWVFSGLLSMDPWGWSTTDDSPDGTHAERLRGGPLDLDAFVLSPAAAFAACRAELEVKEIRLAQLGGAAYYLCVETPFRTALIAADGGEPKALVGFPADTLLAAARDLLPGATVASAEMLDAYDAYYYPGWEDKLVNGGRKRLPVLKLVFDDLERTLIYIDPHSGAPIKAYDSSGRWYRWLFHGLHNLDFPGLYSSRPWWDVIVLPLMIGGVAVSVTGTWVGLKWLKRTLRRVGKRRAAAATRPEARARRD